MTNPPLPVVVHRGGSEALDRLLLVIEDLVRRSGGRWTLELEDPEVLPREGDGAVLVDSRGRICAIVAEHHDVDDDGVIRPVLEAVLMAYEAVVVSEMAARHARQTADEAERAAHHDHLTGLLNRRGWDEALDREDARTGRNDGRAAVAVVDLDELKRVNDAQGHLAGDLLLRRAAKVLTGTLRSSDVLARLGGDEFAVLVVDFDENPKPFTRRLRDALANAGVSASVGVATQSAGEPLRAVLHRADLAMYEHKRRR